MFQEDWCDTAMSNEKRNLSLSHDLVTFQYKTVALIQTPAPCLFFVQNRLNFLPTASKLPEQFILNDLPAMRYTFHYRACASSSSYDREKENGQTSFTPDFSFGGGIKEKFAGLGSIIDRRTVEWTASIVCCELFFRIDVVNLFVGRRSTKDGPR